MRADDEIIPLACDLTVFDPVQAAEHSDALATWRAAIVSRRELDDGFEFGFEYRAETLVALAAFVTNERRCCPFFDFAIELPAAGGLRFRMTGPAGAREILRAGM